MCVATREIARLDGGLELRRPEQHTRTAQQKAADREFQIWGLRCECAHRPLQACTVNSARLHF